MKPLANTLAMPHLPAWYGWVIVVIAALAMVATLPGRTHGLGMITERLLKDPTLQMDRLEFSTINFWGTLLGGLFCLPCGWLIDHFGLRACLTFTVAALACVVLWMTQLTDSSAFAVAILLTRGFGQSALSVISIAMVGKWFATRTSFAMAVYSLLLSLGFAYAAQLAKPWADADWRVVWRAMGYGLLGFVPVCLLFTRDRRPNERGADAKSRGARDPGSNSDPDSHPITHRDERSFTLLEALRTPTFWLFGLATSLVGLISSGLSLFNESVLTSQGFAKSVYYDLLTLTGTVGLLTKLPVGWLGQRLALNRLMSVGLFLLAICMAALPSVHTRLGISLYGVGMGISGTITTVLFFTVWGSVFGPKHLGQIQAMAQLLTVFASALGPIFFARCLASYGNYTPVLLTLAAISTLFALWSWFLALPDRSHTNAKDRARATTSAAVSSTGTSTA